jgi:hypothetical protein
MNLGHFAGLNGQHPLDRSDGRGNLRDLGDPVTRRADWTLSIRDRGRAQWSVNGGTNILTIPSFITIRQLPDGFSVPLIVHVGSLQVTPASGVTLTDGTTTGTITLVAGESRLLTLSPFFDTVGQVWRLL